jgi:uncharacterized membrane protein YczE
MYFYDGQYFLLTLRRKIILFLIAISVISFGNGITIAANLGSAPWTASTVNLSETFNQGKFIFLLLEAIIAAIVAVLLTNKQHIKQSLGNVLFGVIFSFLVAQIASFFIPVLSKIPIPVLLIIDFFGIWCIGIGISIIQRSEFVMHPLDDLTNITRFKFFKGNATKGQISNFIFAIGISAVCFIFTKHISAIGVGTIYAFFFQGKNIAWGDKHIFKNLYHLDPTKVRTK